MLFYVRSKGDTSQLNLPHGTDNQKVEKGKLKSKERICTEVSVDSLMGNHVVSPEEEKERLQ